MWIRDRLKTAVLFRCPEANADDVREVLEQYNRKQVDLLVDLRMDCLLYTSRCV